MKSLLKGTITADWDIVQVKVGDKKITLKPSTMGGTTYTNGEEVKGIIFLEKFLICKKIKHPKYGNLVGYIAMDEVTHKKVLFGLLNKKIEGRSTIQLERELFENAIQPL